MVAHAATYRPILSVAMEPPPFSRDFAMDSLEEYQENILTVNAFLLPVIPLETASPCWRACSSSYR
jgi:hypothetical protein